MIARDNGKVRLLAVALASLVLQLCQSAYAGKSGSNQPPTVQLTSPVNGASFVAPASIVLGANASDPNGTVTRVDFYQGSSLIGSSTAAPFSAVWNNVPMGTYSITAKATDNAGAVTTSVPASVTVTSATALTITSPVSGASLGIFGGQSVSGTFEGPAGSTIVVDNELSSVIATISGNAYTAAFSSDQRLAVGTNVVTVRLTRPDGTSASRSITVNAYDVPYIVFTNLACDVFDAPANIPLAVDAIVPGGAVSQVQFFRGSTVLATLKTPPYQYNWSNVTPGTYDLTAVATSTNGITQSVSRQVRVLGSNTPPTISVTQPSPGAVLTSPATINLAVNVSDPDIGGSIKLVEYFANGNAIGATTVPPFGLTWTNVAPGIHTLTARATDDRGGTTTSNPVAVTVVAPNQPPVVTLTAPAQGATFTAPATVSIVAAANDPDGSIARVEFYQGGTLIGSATAPPYAVDWTNVPAGNFAITARATDNSGAASTSTPVAITVNSAPIQITSPLNGAAVVGDEILVMGRVTAPADSGVQVNGVPAFVDAQGNFYANDVPLMPGQNTIVATLTQLDGTTANHSLGLSSSGPAPIRLNADPLEGGLPLTVTFKISTSNNATLSSAAFDFDGDGAVDYILLPPATALMMSYPIQGVFLSTVTATDSQGRSATRQFAVITDPNKDLRLRSIFNAMLDRLRAGDISGALRFVTHDASPQYESLFIALRDAGTLTAAANALGTLRGSTVGPDIAELILSRETGSGTEAFPIIFLREADGIWRIDSM